MHVHNMNNTFHMLELIILSQTKNAESNTLNSITALFNAKYKKHLKIILDQKADGIIELEILKCKLVFSAMFLLNYRC